MVFALVAAVALACAVPSELPTRQEIDAAAQAVGVRSVPNIIVIRPECWDKDYDYAEALYDDDTQTIKLRKGWRKGPLSNVVLVHEMVHHRQNVNALRLQTPMPERECEAYMFASKWGYDHKFYAQSADQATVGLDYCKLAMVIKLKILGVFE